MDTAANSATPLGMHAHAGKQASRLADGGSGPRKEARRVGVTRRGQA